jgi:chemotaxis-related protein WspD
MSTSLPLATLNGDCWNRIGVAGDRSCPELDEHIHCRNCPAFATAARAFFDRPAPDGYLADWTRLLARPEQALDGDFVSVVIFRLSGEWLALGTHVFVEITHPRPVHRIPHRSGEILTGLVNIRGQLQLCVSLHGLLGIDRTSENSSPDPAPLGARTAYARLVVIQDRAERWAFPAEEVLGVHRVPRSELRGIPSTLTMAANGFSQAVFPWDEHSVGYLDEPRVLLALRRAGQ